MEGFDNICPAAKKAVAKVTASEETAETPNESTATPSKDVVATQDVVDMYQSDDDEPLFSGGNQFVDDEAADDDDDIVPTNKAAENNDDDDDMPVHNDDDDMPVHNDDDSIDDDDDDDDKSDISNNYRFQQAPVERTPEPQAPFAPSSTPLDLARRFLCWNHIGSATLMQGEPGLSRSTVDIDFTDSAFRSPISFTDTMGFILGSLGEDGAIFATDLDEDEDEDLAEDVGDMVNELSDATKEALKRQRKRMKKDTSKATGSTIYFHRFETFGSRSDKDWYYTLPDGERVLGCASGEGWAAVMTSRRFLRLFSSGGNQGHMIWLQGEPVTMVGRSRWLAVVYHDGMPLPNKTQKLAYMVVDAVENRIVSRGPLSCISTGCSLTWIGFSNDGSLNAMDSDGMLSMLVCASG